MYFLDGSFRMNGKIFIDFTKTWSITKFTKTQKRSESSNAVFADNQNNGLNQEKTFSCAYLTAQNHTRKFCVEWIF